MACQSLTRGWDSSLMMEPASQKCLVYNDSRLSCDSSISQLVHFLISLSEFHSLRDKFPNHDSRVKLKQIQQKQNKRVLSLWDSCKQNKHWCPFLHSTSKICLKVSVVPKYLLDCTLSMVCPFPPKMNGHVFCLMDIVSVGVSPHTSWQNCHKGDYRYFHFPKADFKVSLTQNNKGESTHPCGASRRATH